MLRASKCPWCDGKTKVVSPLEGYYRVRCVGDCLACGPTLDSRSAAIRWWNSCRTMDALGDTHKG